MGAESRLLEPRPPTLPLAYILGNRNSRQTQSASSSHNLIATLLAKATLILLEDQQTQLTPFRQPRINQILPSRPEACRPGSVEHSLGSTSSRRYQLTQMSPS